MLTDGRTHDRRKVITIAHPVHSSGELKKVINLSLVELAKYHKNIPKVFDLQSGHEINGLSLSNLTKGDNAKS